LHFAQPKVNTATRVSIPLSGIAWPHPVDGGIQDADRQ
jgi:hypothetical protein